MRVRLPSGSYTQLDVRGSASVLDLKRLLVQVRLRPARRAAHVAGLPLDSVGLRCTYHSNRTTYYVLLYKVPPRVSTVRVFLKIKPPPRCRRAAACSLRDRRSCTSSAPCRTTAPRSPAAASARVPSCAWQGDAVHAHLAAVAPHNNPISRPSFSRVPLPGMRSIHPHKCHLCGWIERIPGGTRQRRRPVNRNFGGLRPRDWRGKCILASSGNGCELCTGSF